MKPCEERQRDPVNSIEYGISRKKFLQRPREERVHIKFEELGVFHSIRRSAELRVMVKE